MEREAAAAAAPPVESAQVDGAADADDAATDTATAGDEASGGLEVPGDPAGTDGASSPESGFVDAKEDAASTPSGESGPTT